MAGMFSRLGLRRPLWARGATPFHPRPRTRVLAKVERLALALLKQEITVF